MLTRHVRLALFLVLAASVCSLELVLPSRAQTLSDVQARLETLIIELQEVANTISTANVECEPALTTTSMPTATPRTTLAPVTTTTPAAGTPLTSCESPSVWNAMAGDYSCGA